MQPLEKALKIVFDFIGNDYVLPTGEFINDDFGNNSQIRNPFYGQTPSKLKFMFGTQKELNIWLATTTDKYPLVWLVYPVTESYNNNPQSFYTYKGIRLIFAINNDAEKLVQIRLQTTKFILDQLIDRFTMLMRNSQFRRFISIDKQVDVKEKFFPNYSTNEQKTSGTVEIWDAITFDCDMHLIPNCIK
jgi:hypothetical protein